MEAYVTLKDYNEDIPNTISFCLINPSKSSIGKIKLFLIRSTNKYNL